MSAGSVPVVPGSPAATTRRARTPARVRVLAVAVLLLLAIAALGAVAAMTGDFPVALPDVVGSLTGSTTGLPRTVVLEWRMPRIAAAVVVGLALGVAGALFQGVTRNALASPDILGLSNGAFVGMLGALVLVGSSWESRTVGALVGGLAAALLIALLASGTGTGGFRFIVVGIAISSMAASLGTWLLLRVELDVAMTASAWGAGTLAGVDATGVGTAAALTAALLCAVPVLSPALRQLELGDDLAAATGVRVAGMRLAALGVGVALVCVATTVAGPVAFIALAAPQIARRLTRTPHIPAAVAALVGAALLLGADLVAQHALPVTVPVGVVTVVIGGCYLVGLLVAEIRRRR
ncbi:iron chelate uptake ABC transporter family permease subunit [Clavibacter michiganensis subsp. phaseoli]|uniref:Iron chelate uptake ABC transporter family permease subunit n=2 Tax=Clavibacter TaxID=1573 RepID=A0A8I0SA66_9MICO|nr:iron chelate uptake ABC transporter family permease subunit [Clavibacter phaseoli]MBF4632377.1 iron chelate uptake ABC transporter family permease subunit [Clavibacter phaseoli]